MNKDWRIEGRRHIDEIERKGLRRKAFFRLALDTSEQKLINGKGAMREHDTGRFSYSTVKRDASLLLFLDKREHQDLLFSSDDGISIEESVLINKFDELLEADNFIQKTSCIDENKMSVTDLKEKWKLEYEFDLKRNRFFEKFGSRNDSSEFDLILYEQKQILTNLKRILNLPKSPHWENHVNDINRVYDICDYDNKEWKEFIYGDPQTLNIEFERNILIGTSIFNKANGDLTQARKIAKANNQKLPDDYLTWRLEKERGFGKTSDWKRVLSEVNGDEEAASICMGFKYFYAVNDGGTSSEEDLPSKSYIVKLFGLSLLAEKARERHSFSPIKIGEFIVYGLRDPVTKEIRWVGQSKQGLNRPKNLVRDRNSNVGCSAWLNSLRTKGLTAEIVVLDRCNSVEALNKAERHHIKEMKNKIGSRLTNHMPGGSESAENYYRRQKREIRVLKAVHGDIEKAACLLNKKAEQLNNELTNKEIKWAAELRERRRIDELKNK